MSKRKTESAKGKSLREALVAMLGEQAADGEGNPTGRTYQETIASALDAAFKAMGGDSA